MREKYGKIVVRLCLIAADGLFWIGFLLLLVGIWTFGQTINFGPEYDHFILSGSIIAPMGLILINVRLMVYVATAGTVARGTDHFVQEICREKCS